MTTITLHLMTQRDQPYGSIRKCCQECGLMMVARPSSFWLKHTWTDKPEDFRRHTGDLGMGDLVPCNQPQGEAA